LPRHQCPLILVSNGYHAVPIMLDHTLCLSPCPHFQMVIETARTIDNPSNESKFMQSYQITGLSGLESIQALPISD
jgi:hypothetical protein